MHKVFTKNIKTTNFLVRGTLGFNCGFAVPLVSAFANQSKIKLFLASTNNLVSCTLPVFKYLVLRVLASNWTAQQNPFLFQGL